MSHDDNLESEAKHATALLKGKIVAQVWRHRKDEIGIEFEDGARLFVDCNSKGLEISITEGFDSEAKQESV